MSTANIAANIARVQQQISAAAARAGRSAAEITLIAVTKYGDTATAERVADAGATHLGESRPQDLWSKAAAFEESGRTVAWHMIGHMQRNKVKRTLKLNPLFHSGDSLRLFRTLNDEAAAAGMTARTLLEVNISGDETKHGFAPADTGAALEEVAALPHVHVGGLMTMAARSGGVSQARRNFAALRTLRDKLQQEFAGRFDLDDLSMGMSNDFEAAIEEGATMVRVGSALFQQHA